MRKKWKIVPKRSAGGRRTWLKDFGAVFFVLLFFPYIVQLFSHGIHFTSNEKNIKNTVESGKYYDTVVVLETNIGIERLPMEEYLVGALAAAMDSGYEEEALKAQTVLLRTAIISQRLNQRMGAFKTAEEESVDLSGLKENEVSQGALKQNYWNLTQMRRAFQDDYEMQYIRLKAIVEDTRSIILTYGGMPVETPFCAVTAGATRNGEEAFGKNTYPSLQSVKCENDILAKNYLKSYSFRWEEIENLLGGFEGGTQSGNAAAESADADILNGDTMEVIKTDSLGYALGVKVGDRVFSGEECRKLLHLNSSNMEIETTDEGVAIRTKGLGHGLGMSQYTADYMAGQGSDFVQILTYFFADCEIQKN